MGEGSQMTISWHKPYTNSKSDHEGGRGRGSKIPKILTTWFMVDPQWRISSYYLITWNFRSFLIRAKFVGSFAFVDAKGRFPNSREKKGMSISSLGENPLLFGHWFPVTEPNDLGFRGSMDFANDFSFIVFLRVNKCLFLFNDGGICKEMIKYKNI